MIRTRRAGSALINVEFCCSARSPPVYCAPDPPATIFSFSF
ncbi:hypothetical protein V1277_006790 [Bradyrhizobium sp. AZCC 1588]